MNKVHFVFYLDTSVRQHPVSAVPYVLYYPDSGTVYTAPSDGRIGCMYCITDGIIITYHNPHRSSKKKRKCSPYLFVLFCLVPNERDPD